MAGGTHYNGYNKTSFYLTDFNSVESMLESAVLSIISKYNNYIVYIHNLSNFDGIFLLKILVKIGYLKPIINYLNPYLNILNFLLLNFTLLDKTIYNRFQKHLKSKIYLVFFLYN